MMIRIVIWGSYFAFIGRFILLCTIRGRNYCLLVDSTNLLGKKIPGEENVFYEPAFYENDMGRKYMGKKLQGSKIQVRKFILRKY